MKPLIPFYIELYQEKKKGVLTVECKSGGRRSVYISSGIPVFAASEAEEDKLQQVLIKKEMITQEQFEEAKNNLDPELSIGKNLVNMGIITQNELVQGARDQVFGIYAASIAEIDASYNFEESDQENDVNLPLTYPADFFKAVMELNDKQWISDQFNDKLTQVFRPASNSGIAESDFSFDPELWQIFKVLNGESDINQISMETHQKDQFTVLKCLYALWQWGAIEEIPLEEEADQIQDELQEAVLSTELNETTEITHVEETAEIERIPVEPETPQPEKQPETIQEDIGIEALEEEDDELPFDHEPGEDPEGDGELENLERQPFFKKMSYIFIALAVLMILCSLLIWSKMGDTAKPMDPVTSSDQVTKTMEEPRDDLSTFEELSKEQDRDIIPNLEDREEMDVQKEEQTTEDTVEIKQEEATTPKPEASNEANDLTEEKTEDPRRLRSPIINPDAYPVSHSKQRTVNPKTKAKERKTATEQVSTVDDTQTKSPEPLPQAKSPNEKKERIPPKTELSDLPASKTKPLSPDTLMSLNRYREAAAAWKKQKASQVAKFCIALELACQKSTINKGWHASRNAPEFFILPRNLNGKDCFWVCWGAYHTQEEANSAMISLPDYFKQGADPKVYPLERLLRAQ
ncbi:MAG: hypothetical protein CSA81_11145 [Acidobacteria bacterium]|nr:MAG: hypothetical protein CSA81_11145 [Acidobacteriota bacterium]